MALVIQKGELSMTTDPDEINRLIEEVEYATGDYTAWGKSLGFATSNALRELRDEVELSGRVLADIEMVLKGKYADYSKISAILLSYKEARK